MKKSNNNKIKIGILILILCITIGYAVIRSGLNINGTTNVSSASWDIYFDNLQTTSNCTVTPSSISNPTPQNKITTINYVVTLGKPGDVFEFTVDGVNNGSLDAMVEDISFKLNDVEIDNDHPLPAYMRYLVTYEDGQEIEEKHLLAHNTHETYKVRVEYRSKDIELSDLPDTNKALEFDFTVVYKQADESAFPHNETGNFVVSATTVEIGQTIPQGVNVRTTPAEAMADWATIEGVAGYTKPFYLKHILNGNNEVTESYVGFVINKAMVDEARDAYIENCSGDQSCIDGYQGAQAGRYYIRGGVDEVSGDNPTPIYNVNQATLLKAFGSSNCSVQGDISCKIPGVGADSTRAGTSQAYSDHYQHICYVYAGSSLFTAGSKCYKSNN